MHCSRHLGCSVEQNQQSRQPSRCVYPSPEPSSAVFPRKYYTPTLTCWNTEFHSYPYSLACGALCFTTYVFKVELNARLGIQLVLVKSHLTGWAKTQTRSFISLICGMGKTKLTNIERCPEYYMRYSCEILSPVCGTLKRTLNVSSYLVSRMQHSASSSGLEISLKLLESALFYRSHFQSPLWLLSLDFLRIWKAWVWNLGKGKGL